MFAVLVALIEITNPSKAVALETTPGTSESQISGVAVRIAKIPVLPQSLPEVNKMANDDGSELQWWRDVKSGKINFRRCESSNGQVVCEAPILFNGLDESDLPKFMAYYSERLEHWGSGHLTSLASTMMGSLGTAAAYIGTFAALKVFKDALPQALPQSVTKLSGSVVFRKGFHLVSVGTIGVLVYFTVNNIRHLVLQKKLLRQFGKLQTEDQWDLPANLTSRALFEEFVATFRRALYEYTHGGPPFDQSDNLIFQ